MDAFRWGVNPVLVEITLSLCQSDSIGVQGTCGASVALVARGTGLGLVYSGLVACIAGIIPIFIGAWGLWRGKKNNKRLSLFT